MRDLLPELTGFRETRSDFALATVVGTWSSAPRQPGASMAVCSDETVVGSVSGGCVEGAVYEECREAMTSQRPKLVRYGVSDDDAFTVGLTCGGILDVFVQPATEELRQVISQVEAAVAERRPVAVATIVASESGEDGAVGRRLLVTPSDATGDIDDERLAQAITDDSRGMLARGLTGTINLGTHGERRMDELSVFVESFAPSPHLIVFGAIDFASAVTRIGKFLGYHVTVCDARSIFATHTRFPDADELVVDWPHRYLEKTEVTETTSMCVLTHDPKFDVPLLRAALRTPARYIGAMGSRRTHEDRVRRLREEGLTEVELSRLRSPIGLDLGSRTPEETAVSIAAELISELWGGTGGPLSQTSAPIHAPTTF